MLVLNLPFKALMFLTLMRPSLVLFLVLWLKLVKDLDRKSGSAGMPRPISYAVFCLKIKTTSPSKDGLYDGFFFSMLRLLSSKLFPYTTLFRSDVLATDNNTVGMGDAGIKSAIQGSNVPNPDEAVPSFVSGAMAKAGKGL